MLDFLEDRTGAEEPHDLGFSDDELQQRLAVFNRRRLVPGLPNPHWRDEINADRDWLLLEGAFLERERRAVAPRAAQAPPDPDGFDAWLTDLTATGPGQGDPLFPWLADTCSMEQMKWVLAQEVAGEAGFEDLTALTQVKMPVGPKLELARNYWDEMGRGNKKGMHGPLLETLARRLGLEPTAEATVWESLALANTMAGLAWNRRYAYHSIGALGIIEQTAPSRAAAIGRGLKRLGVPTADRHYFDLHAILDVKHSEAWNKEAIRPLVVSNPATAHPIAEGALMRLTCGARCFERYRRELGWQADASGAHTIPPQ
ncbi:MAG: iron-containing redox enzyme family protein [Methylobacteriaceae bacterium]|nr:iron-containing redox enzyme family protein [Methylobacteriaceae bacterium]